MNAVQKAVMARLSDLLWRTSIFTDADGTVHHCFVFDSTQIEDDLKDLLEDKFDEGIPEELKNKIPFAIWGRVDPYHADGNKKGLDAVDMSNNRGILFLDVENGTGNDCPVYSVEVIRSSAEPDTLRKAATKLDDLQLRLVREPMLALIEAVRYKRIEDIKKYLPQVKNIQPSEIIAGLRLGECYESLHYLTQQGIKFSSDDLLLALAYENIAFREEKESEIEFLKSTSPFTVKEKTLLRLWERFNHNTIYDHESWKTVLDLLLSKNITLSDTFLRTMLKETSNNQDYLFILENCQDKKEMVKELTEIIAERYPRFSHELLEKIMELGGDISTMEELEISTEKPIPLPSWVCELANLQKLVIVNFSELPANIKSLKKLKKLNVARSTDIKQIPKEIELLSNLERLDIDIERVGLLEGLKLESLKQLVAFGASMYDDNEQIQALPPSVAQLSNLEELTVSANLEILPKEIGRLTKLTFLHVESKKLKTVPPELGELSNLKMLTLSNQLSTLPIEITKLDKLTELNISGNKKIKLPKEFLEMKNLDKESLKEIKKRIVKEIPANASTIFAGQKWCVTGTFKNYKPRETALEIIEAMGGLIGKSVDKTVTHLLTGDKAGDKIDKAEKLKIKIVTEAQFQEMLKPENAPKAANKETIVLKNTAKRDAIIKAIREKKWDVDKEYIVSLLRPSISISTASKKPTLGQSKIGGKPDLPKIFKWPFIYDEDEDGTAPLTFIAQFNLSELKKLDYLNLLPESGMLYLFMYFLIDGAQDEYPDGGRDGWVKVLYYNGDLKELAPASTPKKLKEAEDDGCVGILKESTLTFGEDYTLPSSHDFQKFDLLSEQDKEHLSNMIYEIIPSITKGHTESQFFGFPEAVQSFGFTEEPEKCELPIFFQLSEKLGDFGRCIVDGAFYFYIDKEDLVRGDFKNVTAECQYT